MDDPDLRDYLTAVRRRLGLVIAVLSVVVAATLGLSLAQTPRYRAEAEVLVRRTPSEQLLADQVARVRSADDASREINNELRLIESEVVREAADEAYDGPLDVDDVAAHAASEETDVIELSATATDATAARELVDAYVGTYIEVHRRQQVDDLLATGAEVQGQLDELAARIDEEQAPLDAIDLRIAAAADPEERAALQDERSGVAEDVDAATSSLDNQESYYQQQLDQLQVTAQLAQSGGIQVLTPAEAPDAPVSPRTMRNLVIAAVAGLFAGFGVAVARDRLDDSVRSKEECEAISGLPTLGLIPSAHGRRNQGPDLVTVVDPASPTTEAYRSLRTSVKFLGVDRPVRVLQITSAVAAEGKTTVAANLAVVLAESGERTLLVGADLRRPRLEEMFDVESSPGLVAVLVGDAEIDEATFAFDEVANLHVLPAGPPPPNPAELLGSDRAHTLFEILADRYDTVVVDCAPTLPVADAQIVARLADATLVVVTHGRSSKRAVGRTVELLGQVKAPVVGTVMNMVPAESSYGGGYRYQRYAAHGQRRSPQDESVAAATPGQGGHPVAEGDAPADATGERPSVTAHAHASED